VSVDAVERCRALVAPLTASLLAPAAAGAPSVGARVERRGSVRRDGSTPPAARHARP
jgi:hypothetical protein